MKDRKYLHFDNLRIGAKSRGKKIKFCIKGFETLCDISQCQRDIRFYSIELCNIKLNIKFHDTKFYFELN